MKGCLTLLAASLALGCAASPRSASVRLEPEQPAGRPASATRGALRAALRPGPPRVVAPFLPDEPASRPALSAVGVTADSGLRIETGVGIAPYDDGVELFALLPLDRPGFSDALLRMSYARQVTPGMRLVTTAAAARLQNLTVFETLEDAELAWVTVGMHFSF